MLLIITGPPATGKSTIAKKLQHSTGATLYDEMPQATPADLPDSGLVIITTNSPQLPAWVHDTNHAIVSTAPDILHSHLEFDVHPFEWVSALLADYKTLREKATSAGIENEDPDSEDEMLAHVGRFCSQAANLHAKSNYFYASPSIQSILETLPLPGSSGEQFIICQNRHYPKASSHRFVVRVLKKNFTGNDVARLLLDARAYHEKKGKR